MISDYISNRKLFPCYKCTKRKIGCHGSCPEYKAAAAANTKINEKIRNQLMPSAIVHESPETTRRRWTKRKKGYTGREGK